MSVNSKVSFLYRNESRGYLHKMSSKVLVVPYFLGILRGVIICVGFPLFSPPKEDVPKNLISCRCLLVPYNELCIGIIISLCMMNEGILLVEPYWFFL